MNNVDRFIDRTISHGPSGVEGLTSVDVVRVIADRRQRRDLGTIDRSTLRDIGYDRGAS